MAWTDRDNFCFVCGVLAVFRESGTESITACKEALSGHGIDAAEDIAAKELFDLYDREYLASIFAHGKPPEEPQ